MSPSLLIIGLCLAAVMGTGVPAAKYPAGVDPRACPNYPYCDNTALAVGHHGAVAPYAAPLHSTYGHQSAIAHGADTEYPAGVSPHSCPNYPYCGPTPVHTYAGAYRWSGLTHGVVRPGFYGGYAGPILRHGITADRYGAGARYPAGVDPHSCPNYPYCHH
ncbi:cuticle protein 1-like [Ischnura elegans]|uniref:cuticle protein 1-like n=1 Tax=Ischnura elegans TaxID=197161 RepID=UPI001ED8AF45|nr:cuticle protein 1-like [Ischnura elegans]